jgi:hypothetical protein
MNDKDRSIIAQVAAKGAALMCSGKGRDGINDYLACEETIFNAIIDRSGGSAAAAAAPPAAAAVPPIPAPPAMTTAATPVAQVQASFPGASIVVAPGADAPPPASMPFPAPAAAKPAGRARKKMELDANGFVTDGRQAAWNVAYLCAGQKTDDGKIIVFDNAGKKALGKANGGYAPNAADFNISEVGAAMYDLGNKRIGLWLSDAPTSIQAGDGSIHAFNVEDMHARCGA